METLLIVGLVFLFVISCVIAAFTSLMMKQELKDRDDSVTFLYSKFSDITDFFYIRNENRRNKTIFYFFIFSLIIAMLCFASLAFFMFK